MELLLPRVVAPARILPSYVKLDMAFGVGAGPTLYDKSRYRNHGAITSTDPFWAAGLHGYCGDFAPLTYVEIPAAHTQLNFTSEDFSMVIRDKIDDLTIIRALFYRGVVNVDGYYMFVYDDGRFAVRTNQSGATQISSTTAASVLTNTWYTLGLSRAGASIRLYINGVDATYTAGVHINPATSTRSAKIGIDDAKTGFPLDGKIEFLRIFGGIALPASSHLAWHNALK